MAQLRTLAVLLLIAVLAVAAAAQTETGQVVGTVTDPSGAVVSGATVTLKSVDRQFTRTATTGDNGFYTFTNLQPGTYEVRVEGQGFAPAAQRVQVTVGSRNTADIALRVGGEGETVEVVAQDVATVNTTTQEVSQVVSAVQITQLPTLTRDPYDLVGTAGNVSSGDPQNQTNRGAGFNINGQRSASTNILLDGGENVDLFTSTVGQATPLDAVQEFRVITSNFSAEYGRASGGVVNVATKSGTNSFHGSLYAFNRISALAANTFENSVQGIEKGTFVRNQFGYSVGGPIISDRLFFFSSTEWTRVRSSAPQIVWIPTDAAIAGTSPATQAFFANYAHLPINGPTTVVGGMEFGQVIFNVPSNAGGGDPQNTMATVARIDLNLTDNTTLYGRYALEDQEFFPGTTSFSPYEGFNTGTTNFNNNFLLNLTHLFSPRLVSSTKFVFNRLNNQDPLGEAPVGPTLYLQENVPVRIEGIRVALPGYLPFNPGSAIPFGGPQNLYQFYEDVSWTMGNHQWRFGGMYIHTRDNRTFGAFENSVMNLGAQGDVAGGIANLIAGQLFSFQGAIDPQGKFPCVLDPVAGTPIVTPDCTVNLPVGPPRFSRNNRYNDFAFYVQDSWKVHPRFTLNLGVRWEYFGVQHNVDPRLDSNFYYGEGANLFEQIRNGQVMIAEDSPVGGIWKQDWNNFAPRVGFAWDLSGNGTTSLRGGYGIGYERNFGNVTFNVIQNPPNYAVISLISGIDVPSIPLTGDNAGPLAGAAGAVPLPRTSLRHINQNLSTAYAHFWSASFEQQLITNTILALEYTGSKGVDLYTLENPNRPGSGVVYLGEDPAVVGFNRMNMQYTNLNTRGNNGFSDYHGLNVAVRSSNFREWGLQFTTNYTWSHAIDNLSSTFSESNNQFNLGLLDPFNPELDKGDADFDVRHRFSASAVWETPWFKGDTGWARQIFGGWTLAPIYSAQTGTPFTLWNCQNVLQVCYRWIPPDGDAGSYLATNMITGTDPVTGQPVPQNLFSWFNVTGWQNITNPLFSALIPGGIGDFGLCSTPGQGAQGPCPWPENMIGRNAFRGPARWNLDFGVYKNFAITERVGLQLRGEFFNILNHHNFYLVGSDAEVSVAATPEGIPVKKGGLGGALDERRNIQLGVKLTF